MTQPEGVADWVTNLTPDDAKRYNTIQELLGQQDAALQAGQRLDPSMTANIGKLISENDIWRQTQSDALSETETEWLDFLREARARYAQGLRDAEGWFNESEEFKDLPTYGPGGVREPLEPDDWEVL